MCIRDRVTSGTLSYAYGFGKPVVSTANWHAQELLADGRGQIVPPEDSKALAEGVLYELSGVRGSRELDPRIEEMQWKNVALSYLEAFNSVRRPSLPVKLIVTREIKDNETRLPVQALVDLTDDVGIFQHGLFNFARRSEGYCTDDNVRSLLLMLDAKGTMNEALRSKLESTYLAFLAHSFQEETGSFHNFMGYDRRWLDSRGSQDSQGRAIWALGHVSSKSTDPGHREYARNWFTHNIDCCLQLTSPRSLAYALLGLFELHKANGDENNGEDIRKLASRFVEMYQENASAEWPWWEPVLSYDNARLPQALFICASILQDPVVKMEAIRSLRWLCKLQTAADGVFAPIGCNGFYRQGDRRAWFDQQPIDVTATIDACVTAFAATQNEAWLVEAKRAWEWFHGRNMVGLTMVTCSGGCYDGLMEDGINQNQGAESTIAYLSAHLAIHGQRIEDCPPKKEPLAFMR